MLTRSWPAGAGARRAPTPATPPRPGGLHPRPRRPRRGAAAGLPRGPADRSRPRSRRRWRSPPSGSLPTPTARRSSRRSTTSWPRCSPGSGTPRPGRAARPRAVLAADRRHQPRLRVRRRRPAGHADGRPPGADGRRGPQYLQRPRADPDPADVRRGAVRRPDRPADRRRPRGAAVRHLRPAGRRSSTRSIPAAVRKTGGHPAKRTFQALRIEVNGELAALESVLPAGRRRPRPRRPDRRAGLPLARGPAGQAGAGRRRHGDRAAGPARGAGGVPAPSCGC